MHFAASQDHEGCTAEPGSDHWSDRCLHQTETSEIEKKSSLKSCTANLKQHTSVLSFQTGSSAPEGKLRKAFLTRVGPGPCTVFVLAQLPWGGAATLSHPSN